MKVLLVHNFYRSGTPGGEDVAVVQEQALLERNGVEVVGYRKFNDDVQGLAKKIGVGIQARWSRRVYEEVSELLRKERPHVAHFHNTFPLITASAYAACRDLCVPTVQTLHNYRLLCLGATFYRDGAVCEQCRPGRPAKGVIHGCFGDSMASSASVGWMLWRNWRDQVYTGLVDVYVALTEFAAAKFAQAGIARERIVIKPNFVELESDLLARRKEPGEYAVFAGRLSREKGVHTLLKAWRQLRDIPLWIIGDGPALGDLRSTAERESLPVEFLGMRPRSEVLQVIANAAMQVVPSEWYEGFPLVIVEAYACGTPVVAADIGSLTEIVDPLRTGRRFRAGDHEALASCVRELWENPDLRVTLGQGALDRFAGLYSPQQSFAKLTEIYQLAIERQTARQRASRVVG